jgi:hypothetical protein
MRERERERNIFVKYRDRELKEKFQEKRKQSRKRVI